MVSQSQQYESLLEIAIQELVRIDQEASLGGDAASLHYIKTCARRHRYLRARLDQVHLDQVHPDQVRLSQPQNPEPGMSQAWDKLPVLQEP